MSSPLTAQSQMPRPVIALDCRAAERALPGACSVLKSALRDVAPGAVQRIMDDLSNAPTRPGDVAVALRVEGGQARLDWRMGAGPMQRGAPEPVPRGSDAAPVLRRLVQALPVPF